MGEVYVGLQRDWSFQISPCCGYEQERKAAIREMRCSFRREGESEASAKMPATATLTKFKALE